MAKIERGRIGLPADFVSINSEELIRWAELLEARSRLVQSGDLSSEESDDPKWLQRRANKLRWLAEKKEKAVVHKEGQRTRRRKSDQSEDQPQAG